MKNINSSYIVKSVFSIVNDKMKLKLILYNKKLQKKIDINITNYKIFSGKYKILKFEAEYLNDGKTVIGKEYDSNKLIFEGEYLNGERNGKGKEYYNNGILEYEGEYIYNKKWNGKGYDENSNITELIDGKGYYKSNIVYELMNGKGSIKEYDEYGSIIFEGEYINEKRNIN